MDDIHEVWIAFEPGCKSVEYVTPLGNNQYRMEATPILLDEYTEVYWHDIIEAEPGEDGVLSFRRIVEKGDFSHHSCVLNKEMAASQELLALQQEIEACGGMSERLMGGIFLYHLPETSTLDVNARLDSIAQGSLTPAIVTNNPSKFQLSIDLHRFVDKDQTTYVDSSEQ